MTVIMQVENNVAIVETPNGDVCIHTGNDQPLSKPFANAEAAKGFVHAMRGVDFYPSPEERMMMVYGNMDF